MPDHSLKQTSDQWAKVLGPNTIEGRLAAKRGQQFLEVQVIVGYDGLSWQMTLPPEPCRGRCSYLVEENGCC